MSLDINLPPLAPVAAAATRPSLAVVDLSGDGREAGCAYGEACRELIRQHLERALATLARRRGVGRNEAFERALLYRSATIRREPVLGAEVDGLAEGASLPVPAAWVLQLRAELARPAERATMHECTSFAVVGEASADGGTIAGQNADLPAFYAELLVLVRHRPAGRPHLAMLTPAGQIGYHGMNAAGVAIFANFLHCDGWHLGVPRYLLARVGLAQPTREAALMAVERARRASPRNLLIADESGATDLETTPSETARIEPEGGLLAHSNHYTAPELRALERAEGPYLRNSQRRLQRIKELLTQRRGALNVPAMAEILRDREGAPHALSRALGEWTDDVMTICSTIADVRARRLWIAIGPPHETAYFPYAV